MIAINPYNINQINNYLNGANCLFLYELRTETLPTNDFSIFMQQFRENIKYALREFNSFIQLTFLVNNGQKTYINVSSILDTSSIFLQSNILNFRIINNTNQNNAFTILGFDGSEIYDTAFRQISSNNNCNYSSFVQYPMQSISITNNSITQVLGLTGAENLSNGLFQFSGSVNPVLNFNSSPITATYQLTTFNYTIYSLLEALQTEYLQPTYDIYISNSNGKTYLQIPKIFNNFKLLNNTLSRILGFTGNENLLLNGDNYNLYSTNTSNITYDSYLNIFINNLTVQGFSSSGRPSTFKIPLDNSKNANEPVNSAKSIYLEGIGFKQYHKFTDNNFSLAYLQIEFFDRFGFNVPISDYDLTISFETEEGY
jgi:hypothetical protein